jgi:hypothetical protein
MTLDVSRSYSGIDILTTNGSCRMHLSVIYCNFPCETCLCHTNLLCNLKDVNHVDFFFGWNI